MGYVLKTVYLRYRDEFDPFRRSQGIFPNVKTIDVQGQLGAHQFTVTLDTLHGIRVFDATECKVEIQRAYGERKG